MVARKMKDVEARGFRQGTRKAGRESFHCRRVFREDETVGCLGLTKLNLTAGEMLRLKFMSNRVTWTDAEQQTATACLQRELKYYKEKAAP